MKHIVLLSCLLSFLGSHAWSQDRPYVKTGKKNSQGQDIYYDGTTPANSVCETRRIFLNLRPDTPAAEVCQGTCDSIFAPFLFTALIAGKKNVDGTWSSVPWGQPSDRIFFCGWHPQNGVTEADLAAGSYTAVDLPAANQACKRGTDPNMIMLIGQRSPESCMAACILCPPLTENFPGKCKPSKSKLGECNRLRGRMNFKTCHCDRIVMFPKKELIPRTPAIKGIDAQKKLNQK